MLVVGELGDLLNLGGSTGKSIEDSSNVGSLLHGDDSELILFVNPDKEGLVVVVEDSSARWPVTVESASLKEAVSLPKIKLPVNTLKSSLKIRQNWSKFICGILINQINFSQRLG